MPNFTVSDNIKRLRPYVPGKPIEELERELGLTDVIKLASNESPLGPSPNVIEAITRAASNAHFYPEGSAPVLRDAVAAHLGLDRSMLVFGNGSDEILLLLMMTLVSSPADEVIMGDPSFAMYEIYATTVDAKLIKVPLDSGLKHDLSAIADAITPNTKILFIANPNNPTGTLVDQPDIDAFMTRVPDYVTVVFDEAYFEFVDPATRPETVQYVVGGRNVVVTRTFSKAYALAGVRVGYAIADRELAGYLDRVRSPFNVNLIAQFAAKAALEDQEHMLETVRLNAVNKQILIDGLDGIGLPYIPSEANFVLIDVGDGVSVYNALLHKGVIVRPCKGFGLPKHIRVSIGTKPQMERFLQALTEVVRGQGQSLGGRSL